MNDRAANDRGMNDRGMNDRGREDRGMTANTSPRPGDSRAASSDASVGELVSKVTNDLSTLLRQELELAKAEVKQDATEAGKAAGALGGGGVAALLMLVFTSLAGMYGLDKVMDLWLAALIVAVVWGVVALTLFMVGRNRIRTIDLTPERTIEAVKEDVQWAKTRGR